MAFQYQLEHEDGTPANPPSYHCAVPNVRPGDVILSAVRFAWSRCGTTTPIRRRGWVVEDVAERASGDEC